MNNKTWYVLEVEVRNALRRRLALVTSLEVGGSSQCAIQVPLAIAEEDI